MSRPLSGGNKEKQVMRKLSTAPFRAAKKTERKVGKGKGKETDPGYFSNPLRSARAYLRVKRPKPTCSYDFAGAAAAEVAKIVIHAKRSSTLRSCGSVGRIGVISYPYFGSSPSTEQHGTCHLKKCREGRIFGIATPFCAFFVALHRAIDLEGRDCGEVPQR